MEHKQILKADKEDYEDNVKKLNEFMSITENSNLPLYFKDSIKNVVNSELKTIQFYLDEIETDLNNINADVGVIEDTELTAQQEDFMIEEGLEKIREEKENGI